MQKGVDVKICSASLIIAMVFIFILVITTVVDFNDNNNNNINNNSIHFSTMNNMKLTDLLLTTNLNYEEKLIQPLTTSVGNGEKIAFDFKSFSGNY